MHALTVYLVLETSNLIEFECAFTTINDEEETGGEDSRTHKAETDLHKTIEESFHDVINESNFSFILYINY